MEGTLRPRPLPVGPASPLARPARALIDSGRRGGGQWAGGRAQGADWLRQPASLKGAASLRRRTTRGQPRPFFGGGEDGWVWPVWAWPGG